MDDVTPEMPFDEAFGIQRSIENGFRALTGFFPMMFVGGCLKSCVEGGGGGGNSSFPSSNSDDDQTWDFLQQDQLPTLRAQEGLEGLSRAFESIGALEGGMLALIVVVVIVVTLVLLALRAWIVPGWIRLHAEIAEKGTGSWEVLFSGVDRFVPVFLWQLLQAIIGMGIFALVAAPAAGLAWFAYDSGQSALYWVAGLLFLALGLPVMLYVWLGARLTEQAITLDGLGVVDGLARSWTLVSGNRLWLLLYVFVLGLVRAVLWLPGYCLCCFGVLLTKPIAWGITDYGYTESYLLHTRPREATAAWAQVGGPR